MIPLGLHSWEKLKSSPGDGGVDRAPANRGHLFPGLLICTGFDQNVSPGSWTGWPLTLSPALGILHLGPRPCHEGQPSHSLSPFLSPSPSPSVKQNKPVAEKSIGQHGDSWC